MIFYALYGAGLLGGPLGLSLDAFLLHAGVRGGNVVGSKYAGWGFNPYWDTSGSSTIVNLQGVSIVIYKSGGRRSPVSTSAITDAELRTNSFFLPFLDDDMYQPFSTSILDWTYFTSGAKREEKRDFVSSLDFCSLYIRESR